MASGVSRVLTFLTPYNKAHSYGQLVRSNLINCWGGTHQGRKLAFGLVGFSVSLVTVGVGVQAIKDNHNLFVEGEEGSPLSSLEGSLSRISNFWRKPFQEGGRTGISLDRYFLSSSFNYFLDRSPFRTQTCENDRIRRLSSMGSPLLTYCRFILTTASCEGGENPNNTCSAEDADEDIVCTCMFCSEARAQNIPPEQVALAVANSLKNHTYEEYDPSAPSPPQNSSTCKAPFGPGPSSVPPGPGTTPAQYSTPPPPAPGTPAQSQYSRQAPSGPRTPAPLSKQTTSGSIPVSNKRCGTYSECSKASDPGVDVDALSKRLGGLKQMDWSMETDLSHCLLMRQASQIAVDAVTRIVTEAVSAYADYHAEYIRVLDLLMDALEDSRRACGSDVEVIECKIILIRSKADELKRKIQEVDMFLGSLEKFCNAAAETAFMSHAEYASIAMQERLQSMVTEVRRLREQTREKERDMLDLQSLIIVETGKSLK